MTDFNFLTFNRKIKFSDPKEPVKGFKINVTQLSAYKKGVHKILKVANIKLEKAGASSFPRYCLLELHMLCLSMSHTNGIHNR